MESLDNTNKFSNNKSIIINKQQQIILNNNDNSFSSQTITNNSQKHLIYSDQQQQQKQQQHYSNLTCISPISAQPTTPIIIKNSINLNNNILDNKNRLDNSKEQPKTDNKNESIKNLNLNLDLEAQTDANNKKTTKLKRNTSLISFKSFDFHIKSIYSGIRNKGSGGGGSNSGGASRNSPSTVIIATPTADSSETTTPKQIPIKNRKTPFVKVETVDKDETETLLINYSQSPYQSRRSSYETSTAPLLNVQEFEMISRSQASSPFLCPTSIEGHFRRSSTSDIMGSNAKKTHHLSSGNCSNSSSRRPSTSDLLRKARERKGSESGMMGSRSLSHGGLTRGGGRGGTSYSGGRRTSMAF